MRFTFVEGGSSAPTDRFYADVYGRRLKATHPEHILQAVDRYSASQRLPNPSYIIYDQFGTEPPLINQGEIR